MFRSAFAFDEWLTACSLLVDYRLYSYLYVRDIQPWGKCLNKLLDLEVISALIAPLHCTIFIYAVVVSRQKVEPIFSDFAGELRGVDRVFRIAKWIWRKAEEACSN